jgi:hypothetical protein
MSFEAFNSREAVLAAIKEWDDLGADQFLERYGFRPARAYLLHHNGGTYASKAIVGAAHQFQFPREGPLTPTDFTGGKNGAAKKLEQLGFRVTFQPQ